MTKLACAVLAIYVLPGGFLRAQEMSTSEAPQTRIANADLIKMLRAGVPESTLVSEIELLAGRGATFDISPSAIAELKRAGASEKVLNTVVWAQITIAPGIEIQRARGVFYRTGETGAELRLFFLSPEFGMRWSTWPFYATGPKERALGASPYAVQIAESSPTLLVQGFKPDDGWQLVRIRRDNDHREMKLKRKHAYSDDFFSDSVFDKETLRPITFANAGADSFTVRPSAPLEAGDYALCGQVTIGGWLRACYEFHVSGM